MNYWLVSIVILLLISPAVFAKEIKTETSTGKDGEPITTRYYEGEVDDMVKRIQYGAGPKYRLEERYFGPDAKNEQGEKNYLVKVEYYNAVYPSEDPHHPLAERRVATLSNDRPDFISQLTDYNINGNATTEIKYRPGSKDNKDRQVTTVNDKGQTQLIQSYYYEGGNNTEHFKLYNTLFANGVLVGSDRFYYEGRSDYLSRDSIIYTTDDPDKPEDQRKRHNEGKDFYDNPAGGKRYVAINEPDGRTISTTYFDKTKSKDGITEMDEIRLAGQITNQVIFYGVLYKGRIAKSVSERGADGLWYSRYFDAAGTEIQP